MQKNKLERLGKLQRSAVAGLEAQALQVSRRTIDQLIQFRIGDALKRRVNEFQRDLIGIAADVFGEGV